jgi:glycerol uptake facilitator protein
MPTTQAKFLGEFIGTAILVLFGNGAVTNVALAAFRKNVAMPWLTNAVGWGVAVTVAAYTVGSTSGAHLNPAVTLGQCVVANNFECKDMPIYFVGQYLGAFVGALLTYLCYYGLWKSKGMLDVDPVEATTAGVNMDTAYEGVPLVKRGGARTSREDATLADLPATTKLSLFSTVPITPEWVPAFIIEFLGTGALVLVVTMLSFDGVEVGQQSTGDLTQLFDSGLSPLAVGILVFAVNLALGGPAGFAINPARDLGPRIAHAILPIPDKGSSQWWFALVATFGPLLGGLAGAGLAQGIHAL